VSEPASSQALLNARYVAIRTAEAKGLTERLLEASRDHTPGVRRLLIPILYRFWHRDREHGWALIEKLAEGMVRFPGMLDMETVEIMGALSMPILNACRHEPEQLQRLASLWRTHLGRLFASPMAKTLGVIGRFNLVVKRGAAVVADLMKRQPIYQPVNYAELKTTFGRSADFRVAWSEALACLEHPETAPGPIERILTQPDLPFDLYLMIVCERALIYYAARTDPERGFDLLERLYHEGRPWFRHSILYAIFYVLSFAPTVRDDWIDRYDTLAEDFFTSGAWRLDTESGHYVMATHVANADVASALRWPGRPPRVVAALMKRAIEAGDGQQIAALFAAIDGVAFYHGNGALALSMLEAAQQLGGEAVEARVIASLASVRLLDQPLVDASLDQRRSFADISPERVAATEPSVTEEDLLTLIDGFIIHSMVTSDGLRALICGVFRRGTETHSLEGFLTQLLQMVRDELVR
jgi:hypothetical protein